MRSFGQLPKILFFHHGMVPTQEHMDAAAEVKGRVMFRNADLVDPVGDSALEECDGVAGDVPPRYAAAFPNSAGEVSGVGALRVVHDGEEGVSENQAVNLDSRTTGVAVEEERRRAHRGLSVNEPGARISADPAYQTKMQPLAAGAAPEGSTNSGEAQTPLAAAPWTSAPSGVPGAASMPASVAAIKRTGDDTAGGVKPDLWSTTPPATAADATDATAADATDATAATLPQGSNNASE